MNRYPLKNQSVTANPRLNTHLLLAAITMLSCLFLISTILWPTPAFASSKFAPPGDPRLGMWHGGDGGIDTRQNSERTIIGTVVPSSDLSDPKKTIVTKDKSIKMTVVAGIKGHLHPQRWMPVQFTVENHGPAVSGYVEAVIDTPDGGYPIFVNRKRLDLPTDAKKKVELSVLSDPRSFKVRYVSEDKVLLQVPVTARFVDLGSYLIGVLTNEDSSLNFYKDVSAIRQGWRLATYYNASELPESGPGFSSLDIFFINGTSTKDLTAGQKKALAGWVEDGGLLVLGGGADAAKVIGNLPSELVPVEIAGSKTCQALPSPLKLSSAYLDHGPYIYASVNNFEGEVVSGDKNEPYVINKKVGKGHVIWVAFDLNSKPFSEWRENENFWNKIVSSQGANIRDPNRGYPWYGSLSGMLFNIPALKAPSLSMVLAFLFLYLLLVSPLNYFILKKLDRREWAWITIPLLIVIFGLSSYWYAYIRKGGDVIINQLGVMEVSSGKEDSRIYNVFGIFSPGKRSYTIKIPEGMAGSPTPEYYYDGPRTSLDPAVVDQEAGTISDFSIASWTMRSFMTTGRIKLQEELVCDLSYTKDGVKGKIKNNFDFPLTDAFFIAGRHTHKLGTLRPGAEKRVDLEFKQTAAIRPMSIGERLFIGDRNRFRNMGGPDSYGQGSFLKIEMLNQILGYEGEFVPKSPTLIAWINKPLVKPAISGRKPIYRGQTMLISPININSSDYFIVNPGEIKRSLINKKGNIRFHGNMNFGGSNFSASKGSAEFEYALPVEKKFTPVALNLYMGPIPLEHIGPQKAYKIFIYNAKVNNWSQINHRMIKNNSIDLKPPQDYIGPDNKMRIRIDVDAKKWGELYFRNFDFEVVGKWQ